MNKMIFIVTLLIFYGVTDCLACKCTELTIESRVNNADVVLTGKVLSTTPFEVKDGSPMRLVEVKILKQKQLKGELVGDTVSVITGVGGGDCGVQFTVGKSYIIYSTYSTKYAPSGTTIPKLLETNICMQTKLYDKKEAKDVKQYLRKIKFRPLTTD